MKVNKKELEIHGSIDPIYVEPISECFNIVRIFDRLRAQASVHKNELPEINISVDFKSVKRYR